MSASMLAVGAGALLAATLSTSAASQDRGALDATVRVFLDRHRGTWHDLNVPESDGRVLHDLIVKHKFTRALAIGTSTGHSGVWIAWALAKTGGRLTTVELDPGRYRTAVANFKEAGLATYIDARLGDAHEIVPALSGPFDFVFSDADKDWVQELPRRRLAEAASGGLLHGPQCLRQGGRCGNRRVPGASQDAARCRDHDRQHQPRRHLDQL